LRYVINVHDKLLLQL